MRPPPTRASSAAVANGCRLICRDQPEARRRLLAEGVQVIDFGKGDPNEPTDPMIRQALVNALPERSPYPLAQGLPELRQAAAAWCGSRFGAEIDPDTEIVPTYGSKEA